MPASANRRRVQATAAKAGVPQVVTLEDDTGARVHTTDVSRSHTSGGVMLVGWWGEDHRPVGAHEVPGVPQTMTPAERERVLQRHRYRAMALGLDVD